MKFNQLIPAASILLGAAALTACNRTGDENAPATGVEPAPAAATPQAVEINAPIRSRDIDLVFTAVGSPEYNPATDTLAYTVNVANNGKAPVASNGTHPVNLGVVILGADGTLTTPPAKQDFVRIRLPAALEPGQNVDVPVKFKVAPALGGTVIVDAVQERVAWFRGYGKPTLTLGSFVRCNEDPKTVCLSDGAAVASAR